MARVYQITETEIFALIEKLELDKLREFNKHAPTSSIHKENISDIHRMFNYHVVRCAQEIGFDGYRKY